MSDDPNLVRLSGADAQYVAIRFHVVSLRPEVSCKVCIVATADVHALAENLGDECVRHCLCEQTPGRDDNDVIGDLTDLLESQFAKSLIVCTKGPRRSRWLRAMETLSTADGILADTDLATLLTSDNAETVFANLSSGHKIVLLTMTRLVELVEEQSLVLVDEPETHLHPPLLSALTRAISDLMTNRNGVAIIATHSPVVLQEVPRTCTWMMQRSGEDVRASQLATETFGESVSRLTSEVFHLDINRTGYHHVLRMLLEEHGGSAEQALGAIDGQLGSEGRFLLSALDGSEEPDNV